MQETLSQDVGPVESLRVGYNDVFLTSPLVAYKTSSYLGVVDPANRCLSIELCLRCGEATGRGTETTDLPR